MSNETIPFLTGTDEVIDASVLGSRARYINHSCDPNCYAVATLPEKQQQEETFIDNSRASLPSEQCVSRKQARPSKQITVSSREDDRLYLPLCNRVEDEWLQPQSMAESMLVDQKNNPERKLPQAMRLLLSRRHCELLKDNHSHRRRVFVYSARYIRAGEELTYDYQFPMDERKVACKCGSTACRGTINMVSNEMEDDIYLRAVEGRTQSTQAASQESSEVCMSENKEGHNSEEEMESQETRTSNSSHSRTY